MYRLDGKKGKTMIKLNDSRTKWGWEIKSNDDVILALDGYSIFQTVARCFIEEAVKEAEHDRSEWNDIEEFAQYIAENYI